MAEAFKNLINAQTVAHAAQHLRRVWPSFDSERFQQLAANLDPLAFKARAMLLASALEQTLPPRFDKAADVLERSLAPPLPLNEHGEPLGLGTAESEAGLSGWMLWAAGEFVARRGMDDVPRALACLHALTQRFTAEFAIRAFIAQHPELVFPTLAHWTHDPSAHVRRLVSEGSRPRLPWGLRLQALVDDPTPTLPLLQALQDDPSAYVRRSVANHLNDIAKDHPELVADWVRQHLTQASTERRALLRHASRSLVKQGHVPTLAAWGLAHGVKGRASLAVSPATVTVGGGIVIAATLQSTSAHAQDLVVDYAVHHRRANGQATPKVFKGWKLRLAAHEEVTLNKRHSLKPVTTRRLYPGRHVVDLRVNGLVVASTEFLLMP